MRASPTCLTTSPTSRTTRTGQARVLGRHDTGDPHRRCPGTTSRPLSACVFVLCASPVSACAARSPSPLRSWATPVRCSAWGSRCGRRCSAVGHARRACWRPRPVIRAAEASSPTPAWAVLRAQRGAIRHEFFRARGSTQVQPDRPLPRLEDQRKGEEGATSPLSGNEGEQPRGPRLVPREAQAYPSGSSRVSCSPPKRVRDLVAALGQVPRPRGYRRPGFPAPLGRCRSGSCVTVLSLR